MTSVALLCSLTALLCAFPGVLCLTKGEFHEILKEYAKGEKIAEGSTNDDVINISGHPDDELEVEDLMSKLGFQETFQNLPWNENGVDESLSLSHGNNLKYASVVCHDNECHCCLDHKFDIDLFFTHLRYNLNTCFSVSYIRKIHAFLLKFSMNGKTMYNKPFSLIFPKPICYSPPKLPKLFHVCFVLYGFNPRTSRMCARITADADIKFRKFHFQYKIACFHLPFHDEASSKKRLSSVQLSVSEEAHGKEEKITLTKVHEEFKE